MNTDTNQIYWDAEAVRQAERRGEPLMPLIPIKDAPARTRKAWEYDERGNLLPRHERRRRDKQMRKAHG